MALKKTIASLGIILCCISPNASHAQTTTQNQPELTKQTSKKVKAKKPSQHFMRIRKNHRGKLIALETSITRYELKNTNNETVTVDLIGAVHIGEKDYFQALNERFEKYDSMLYELVAPEGTVIPKGGRESSGVPTNPLAAMQVAMQESLGLEFQLEQIDYNKANFKHADMSPAEFAESMVNNDESIMKYGLKAIGQGMAMQASGKSASSIDMLMSVFASNKQMSMRRTFAKQIQQVETGSVIFQGKNGSTIVTHRNAKCMEVLQQEINAGKTNLAIFYGAAHLPDMEQRMFNDFKAKRAGQIWLEAWKLTDKK